MKYIWSKSFCIRKVFFSFVPFLLLFALTSCFTLKVSPWPTAMLIRYEFEKNGRETNDKLEKYVPQGISQMLDISYSDTDPDAKLDVYYPTEPMKNLPAIVWIHGGAWVSGNKEQMNNYYKILAGKGFTVISVNYSIAPEKKYPLPVKQVMTALKFLSENAGHFYFDPNLIFMGGDSAGAHIVAQVANIISEPDYAALMQISPTISRSQLRGLILYCGPYNAADVDLNGEFGKFLQTVLWSYSGDKNFMKDPKFQTASVINYIGKNFPPSFISAGNGDPLLIHSETLAKKLKSLHIETETLFFPKNYTPQLPHEYQFNLETEAAQTALKNSVDFVEAHVSKNTPTSEK